MEKRLLIAPMTKITVGQSSVHSAPGSTCQEEVLTLATCSIYLLFQPPVEEQEASERKTTVSTTIAEFHAQIESRMFSFVPSNQLECWVEKQQ